MGMETAPRKTERDLEMEQDDEYFLDMRKWWDLKNPEERYDPIPEICDGYNIADFIDPEFDERLDELEKEEGMREEAGFYDNNSEEEDEETKEIRQMAAKIRETRSIRLQESHLRRKVKKAKLPTKNSKEDKTPAEMVEKLGELGIDITDADEGSHFRSRSLVRRARKREASQARMDTEGGVVATRSQSRARSMSRPRDESGLRDASMVQKAKKLAKISQRPMIRMGKAGESDRHIPTLKPKHLLTGKRGIGKTQRR